MKKSIMFVMILALLLPSVIHADTGSLGGMVYYSGVENGTIIVAAFNMNLDFNNILQLDTLEAGPAEYRFTGLSDGKYLLAAFMDLNGDGLPGFVEPLGAHPSTVEIIDNNELTGIDIYLNQLPRGEKSLSGSVQYAGEATGTIHLYAIGISGTPFNHLELDSQGGFNFADLSAGEYILVSYMDLNENEMPDINEPVGYIDEVIKIDDTTTEYMIDLVLYEPGDFNGSLHGMVNYSGNLDGKVHIYAVGLTRTPINLAIIDSPNSGYEVKNLDQGDYYVFAFLDTNESAAFDPLKLKTQGIPGLIAGEPYELIAEPVTLEENGRSEIDLELNEYGDAGISGTITYNGSQSGLILTAAIGLSPVWLGLAPANPGSSSNRFEYTIPALDAGYYGVISLMLTNLFNPTFNLSTPFGFYTDGLVKVSAHDTVENIDFYMQDSTTTMSKIHVSVEAPDNEEGKIHMFALGLSLSPYHHIVMDTEGEHVFPNLRMGRYLVAAFMDVNDNGTFDLGEPYDITLDLVNIPHGSLDEFVTLEMTAEEPTRIEVAVNEFPEKQFALSKNYPNPFNPSTSFSYQLPEAVHVNVTIIDMLGREVRSLIDDEQIQGIHKVEWDGKDNSGINVSSGVYIYCIKAGNYFNFNKMTLIR